ncbi:MAG: riboflavin biosynthesis protein RibF [Acidobacteria bacterium]|nr:riboflavin biosynthesis protein RibF [Acidobacteriota bacterium]
MNVYRSLSDLPAGFGPTVATIGNFDGVHLGHRWVLGEVIHRAHALNARSLAITFDPHPARVLRPQTPLPLITPLAQKLTLLEATGVDATLVLPFTAELSQMTARDFAAHILHDKLGIVELHEGENFRFGHNAEAGVDSLEALGRELGFAVSIYTPRSTHGLAVSSSLIRKLIAAGNASRARALLGRPFAIHSTPASGRGYGTRYTVPTINLAPYAELIPAIGVYITTLTVNGETFDAVTNIGNRPTFGADSFTIESHLLNFHPIDLHEDTPLTLTFLHRLRDETRWPSPEALREQIGRDVRRAQRYFSVCRLLTSHNLPKNLSS